MAVSIRKCSPKLYPQANIDVIQEVPVRSSQRRNWVGRILPDSMLLLFLQNNFPGMLILTFFINSHLIFIPKHSIDMNYLLSLVIIGFLWDLPLFVPASKSKRELTSFVLPWILRIPREILPLTTLKAYNPEA